MILFSGAEFMIPVFNVQEYLGDDTAFNLIVVSGLMAIIGGCYAIFGGLKAVAVSDTVNGIGLAIGGLLIPICGLSFVGGGDVIEGLSTIMQEHPERMAPIGDSDAAIPWQTLFTGVTLLTTFYWCTNQGIVQRTFAAKNLAEGQKGTLFAAFMKLLGPVYLVLPGIIAWHIVSSGRYDIPSDVAMPADGNGAYGFLVRLVLPRWAVGFFAATILGAILSSFNSFLNSGSTLFGFDIYKGLINRNATDLQAVRAGRIFAGVVVPVSVSLVLVFKYFPNKGLFSQLIQFISVTNIPFIAIVIVALVSKRTPAIAVNVALIVGMVFQLVFGILWEDGLGIHGLHVAGANFALLMVIMGAFRLLMPQQEPFEQQHSGDVDITPWKLAKPVGCGIAVIIAAIYFGMWNQFGVIPGKQVAADYELVHPLTDAGSVDSGQED
jgi:SSS family solute:Na+ symporter